MKTKQARLFISIILLFQFLSFLIYGDSLKDSFIGDDYNFIFESLQEKSNFFEIWFNRFGTLRYYRPVDFLTYRLNFLWGGLNPYSYHFVNIVLHGINCSLIFFIVHLLLKGSVFISLCPALFFIVHPINSIAANWIPARGELLCSFFVLLSLVSYYCFLHQSGQRHVYYTFSALACFLAFASKEHAFTLPILILICDIWNLPEDTAKKRLKKIAPFFILLGLFLVLRYFVLKEIFWGGCQYSLFDYRHIFENLFRAMKLMVMPIRPILANPFYAYLLFFFLILISIIPILCKDKKIIFALLWFFITFGALYNFYAFPSYNLYLQNIGLCLFIPFLTEFYLMAFFKNKKAVKTLAFSGIILFILSVYSGMTVKRNSYAHRAARAGELFIKGVLKLYPRYPQGSTFYFINAPFLIGENQIYGGSEMIGSALSLNYGLYHQKIPAYAFTFMLDTTKVENKVEVEIKDENTLIVSSKDVYFNYRDDEDGAQYAAAQEVDCPNLAATRGFVTARKLRLMLKEEIKKIPEKYFFYFSDGVIYELKDFI